MELIPLIATKETIDIKKGGLITYDTDQKVNQPGILLLSDSAGDYGLMLVDQVHKEGPVQMKMRPVMQPARKYSIGTLIGYLAIF